MKLLHKVIFWSHLLAGVIGGVVIFIMSATGVILMYERQMVEYAERDVRKVVPPSVDAPRLSLDALVAKAREQNPDSRLTGVVLRNEPTASVAIGFGREGAIYVNPYTGAVLGKESNLHDWFHDVTDWHRWLGTEDEGRDTARAITGACNLAFFWLAVTGVYLWWPRSWQWRGLKTSLLFNFRLRGKARDWNWHNVIGFWSSAVIVVLTLTAAVMSYPWANDLLYVLAGSTPPPRSQGNSPVSQTPERRAGGASRERKLSASFDAFLARAERQAPGWVMMMMRLPPYGDGPINVLIQEPTAPHIFARSQLQLNRSTAELIKWESYASASPGRKARIWVRGLHTGEALGLVGQTVAGLASLGGCFLVWTGFAMAWRRLRSWRRTPKEFTAEEFVMNLNSEPINIPDQRGPESEGIDDGVATSLSEATTGPLNGVNAHARAVQDLARERATAPFNGESVLILYGTVTGNAEALAKKVAEALHASGRTARVRDMAHCQPNVLTQANCVLLVASTYGDGEPPDDAAPFCEAVVHSSGLNLIGIKFSVLALGNTTYDHFCKCGRELDAALERHGGTRLYPRVDCDVDYDAPARRWMEGVLASLYQEQSFLASA